MIVNFNDEEAIITFSGLQIVIQKEEAVKMSGFFVTEIWCQTLPLRQSGK